MIIHFTSFSLGECTNTLVNKHEECFSGLILRQEGKIQESLEQFQVENHSRFLSAVPNSAGVQYSEA